MVRSCKGIEMMVNLINIAYCAMKLLPYQYERFSDYRDKSVQDFRFALSEGIRQQVFFATFVQNIEIRIKSSSVINALKQLFLKIKFLMEEYYAKEVNWEISNYNCTCCYINISEYNKIPNLESYYCN